MADSLPKLNTKSGLDPRFEWNESVEENHIFDEEKKMIADLRERLKDVFNDRGEISDKLLCVFLIGRKHDMDRTEKMLRLHFQWRDENGWKHENDIPKLKELDLTLFECGATYEPDGCIDKFGRLLSYRFVANMDPKLMDQVENLKPLILWAFLYRVNAERSAAVQLMTAEGFKMSNMRMNNGMNKLQDLFPMRIRQIYMLNAGWVITPLLSLLRFVIKAKVIQRIVTVKESQLQYVIDAEHLPAEYGGKMTIDNKGWVAAMKANTKQQRRSHKKHHRHGSYNKQHEATDSQQPSTEDAPPETDKPKKSKKKSKKEAKDAIPM